MVEFARLAGSSDADAVTDREARLIEPARPDVVRIELLKLLKQHQFEWDSFVSSLPHRSWVREIVGQL
jgi:hypothetical protein